MRHTGLSLPSGFLDFSREWRRYFSNLAAWVTADSAQLSTSTNNTGNPASGAWSTASARTPARLPLLVGRVSAISVGQEPTQPIPCGSSTSPGAGACSAAGAPSGRAAGAARAGSPWRACG
ncbi:hypothetical protein ACWDBO_19750 [Streptomyces mirabilis]|uniref:hypothetical protein n=1 Tax=Streptomyces TaxID=1883 RepID=UPI0029BACC0E|nr:hypothetical protein [Streptomyces sp. AK02-04a]MDX3759597.1 hypothetical protein [Streptomyces sp. AK02-04a]